MNKHTTLLYWTPRLLGIAAILFIGFLSLDTLASATTVTDLFMLLLPAMALTLILAIAWRWELAGGITFLLMGLGLIPFIYNLNHGRNHFSVGQSLLVVLIVNVPLVLIGLLFIVSYYRKNKTGMGVLS
jgi:hypothetical protein